MKRTRPSKSPVETLETHHQEYIPFTTIVNNNIHIKHKRDLNFKLHKGTFLLTPWAHTPVPYREVVEWDLGTKFIPDYVLAGISRAIFMVPGSEGERWDQIVDVEMETDDEDDEELEDGDEPRVPR